MGGLCEYIVHNTRVTSNKNDPHEYNVFSRIFPDLYRMMGDRAREAEGVETHNSYSQGLLKDHFFANQLPEHNLILWTDGPLPAITSSSSSNTGASMSQQI